MRGCVPCSDTILRTAQPRHGVMRRPTAAGRSSGRAVNNQAPHRPTSGPEQVALIERPPPYPAPPHSEVVTAMDAFQGTPSAQERASAASKPPAQRVPSFPWNGAGQTAGCGCLSGQSSAGTSGHGGIGRQNRQDCSSTGRGVAAVRAAKLGPAPTEAETARVATGGRGGRRGRRQQRSPRRRRRR